jgi:DNA-binding transcriptional regulator GbsR (MarR family)
MNAVSEKLHYIEEYGVCLEDSGLPRMAGRILGLLLVCTPPHLAADQIAEILDASKGTVSTMTRLLMQYGLIEKIGLPGERRDYFRLRLDLGEQLIATKIAEISRMRSMAERGLALMESDLPEERQRLAEILNFYTYFERELPALLDRYHQRSIS